MPDVQLIRQQGMLLRLHRLKMLIEQLRLPHSWSCWSSRIWLDPRCGGICMKGNCVFRFSIHEFCCALLPVWPSELPAEQHASGVLLMLTMTSCCIAAGLKWPGMTTDGELLLLVAAACWLPHCTLPFCWQRPQERQLSSCSQQSLRSPCCVLASSSWPDTAQSH